MDDEDLDDAVLAARIGGMIRHTFEAAVAQPAHPEMWSRPHQLAEDLADEFYNAMLLAEANAWDYRPPAAVVRLLRDINARLDDMFAADDETAWEAGAVDMHPAWQEVRALAGQALLAYEVPDERSH